MEKKERFRYNVRGKDITGKKFCYTTMISDTGSNKINIKYIKDRLPEKFKMYKNLDIEREEPITLKRLSEELKEDVFSAIKNTEKIVIVGFAAKLPKKMREELGADINQKLDDINFHKLLILYWCYNALSCRKIEDIQLDVKAIYYHGGHIIGRFLHKYYNLYLEHKGCLDDNDVSSILKKTKIYNITRTQTIKTKIELSNSIKDLMLMEKSISNQHQKNIGDWVN